MEERLFAFSSDDRCTRQHKAASRQRFGQVLIPTKEELPAQRRSRGVTCPVLLSELATIGEVRNSYGVSAYKNQRQGDISLARYLALICVFLQVQVAYHGYTQCLVFMSPEIREMCRENACSQNPDPEPEPTQVAEAGCCGGSSCPMASDMPISCDQTQTAPVSQKRCDMPDGHAGCCMAICSYVAGVPSEKQLVGAIDYSLHTPNDLIGTNTAPYSYILSNAPPPRSIHPAISITVLRI
jgi:hypothetical protein